jgi:hypothetical protein
MFDFHMQIKCRVAHISFTANGANKLFINIIGLGSRLDPTGDLFLKTE